MTASSVSDSRRHSADHTINEACPSEFPSAHRPDLLLGAGTSAEAPPPIRLNVASRPVALYGQN